MKYIKLEKLNKKGGNSNLLLILTIYFTSFQQLLVNNETQLLNKPAKI